MVDETVVVEPKTTEGEAVVETVEEVKARLAKAEELANNYKVRAEKAEKQSREVPSEYGNLNPRDAVILAKADVDPEDIETVIDYAGFKKQSISAILKDSAMQTILKTNAEERKSAAATAINPPGRQAPRETVESILQAASQGQLPESDEGIERLTEARIAAKIARSKK